MTNEQTIDAICSELVRYSETVHGGASRAMRHAEHALLSAQRQLAAKDAEIAELKQRLADSGCDLQAIKSSPAPEQEPSAWRIKQGARVYLISHAEFVRTSFDAASMTPLYEMSLPSIDHAPTTAPGEWVEWKGGKCPIADGVLHQVKFRDGSPSQICHDAPSWSWRNDGSQFDIVAYLVLA